MLILSCTLGQSFYLTSDTHQRCSDHTKGGAYTNFKTNNQLNNLPIDSRSRKIQPTSRVCFLTGVGLL